MKYLKFVPAVAVLVLSVAALLLLNKTSDNCATSYRKDAVVRINNHSFTAEIAKTDDQHTKGLGGRACIGENEAMLFEFDQAGYYPFWMKDMKFPIDIVWINANHRVITIRSNIAPSTYPKTFASTALSQYVLEVKAGEVKTLGVAQGTSIIF